MAKVYESSRGRKFRMTRKNGVCGFEVYRDTAKEWRLYAVFRVVNGMWGTNVAGMTITSKTMKNLIQQVVDDSDIVEFVDDASIGHS